MNIRKLLPCRQTQLFTHWVPLRCEQKLGRGSDIKQGQMTSNIIRRHVSACPKQQNATTETITEIKNTTETTRTRRLKQPKPPKHAKTQNRRKQAWLTYRIQGHHYHIIEWQKLLLLSVSFSKRFWPICMCWPWIPYSCSASALNYDVHMATETLFREVRNFDPHAQGTGYLNRTLDLISFWSFRKFRFAVLGFSTCHKVTVPLHSFLYNK